MYPPNLFHDVCQNPTPLNDALKRMKLTKVSDKVVSYENLLIINFDCKHAHKNKIQLKFFKYIIDYYEQDSVTVYNVLKQQHYQSLIITNKDEKFVGGVLYVLSPTEGSFIFFLHIDENFRSKGLGTLLLQMIQKQTRNKLKTSNMLVWIEVHPKQPDISFYYKKLGFHLTPPDKHDIQNIVPASVLSVIHNKKLYSYILKCSNVIKEVKEITQVTKDGKCDMCQAVGCALVCKHKDKKSHILQSQNNGKTIFNICGTSLCMTCQISFGITNKHRCAIHTHTILNDSDTKQHFSDNSYQTYIKTFLNNSKEDNNKKGFWQEPENISQNFKYCRHCRIHEYIYFNSSSFEQIPIRLKNESSLNNMLQHPTDIHFFNRMQELHLDQPAPCLQYPNKIHSNYLDSNLGSTRSILTNTFFGIKEVTGIGDCGFLCLMIAINSDKQISELFQSQVEDFYQSNFNMNPFKKQKKKKSKASLKATENIIAFKELFMQMHTLVFNKINKTNSIEIQNEGNAEIFFMEMDYEPTGKLNEVFVK